MRGGVDEEEGGGTRGAGGGRRVSGRPDQAGGRSEALVTVAIGPVGSGDGGRHCACRWSGVC